MEKLKQQWRHLRGDPAAAGLVLCLAALTVFGGNFIFSMLATPPFKISAYQAVSFPSVPAESEEPPPEGSFFSAAGYSENNDGNPAIQWQDKDGKEAPRQEPPASLVVPQLEAAGQTAPTAAQAHFRSIVNEPRISQQTVQKFWFSQEKSTSDSKKLLYARVSSRSLSRNVTSAKGSDRGFSSRRLAAAVNPQDLAYGSQAQAHGYGHDELSAEQGSFGRFYGAANVATGVGQSALANSPGADLQTSSQSGMASGGPVSSLNGQTAQAGSSGNLTDKKPAPTQEVKPFKPLIVLELAAAQCYNTDQSAQAFTAAIQAYVDGSAAGYDYLADEAATTERFPCDAGMADFQKIVEIPGTALYGSAIVAAGKLGSAADVKLAQRLNIQPYTDPFFADICWFSILVHLNPSNNCAPVQ